MIATLDFNLTNVTYTNMRLYTQSDALSGRVIGNSKLWKAYICRRLIWGRLCTSMLAAQKLCVQTVVKICGIACRSPAALPRSG